MSARAISKRGMGSGAYVRQSVPKDAASAIEVMTEEYVRNCLEKGMELGDISRFVNEAIAKFEAEEELGNVRSSGAIDKRRHWAEGVVRCFQREGALF